MKYEIDDLMKYEINELMKYEMKEVIHCLEILLFLLLFPISLLTSPHMLNLKIIMKPLLVDLHFFKAHKTAYKH